MLVGIQRVKSSIDSIIREVSRSHAPPGGVLENDDAALAILLDASDSLLWAANYADMWRQAARDGDMARANHYYVIACDKTSISRSQIARTRTAAAEPPQGLLSAYGDELKTHLEELDKIRIDNGCP